MNKRLIGFVLLLLVIGCSSSHEVLVRKDFSGSGIAVLNFSTQGSFMEPNIGRVAADKLTNAFFLVKEYEVIDRSIVNEAQVKADIKSSEVISNDQIKTVGDLVKANYIVVGKIHQISNHREFLNTDSEKQLNITFRIISSRLSGSQKAGRANCATKFTVS